MYRLFGIIWNYKGAAMEDYQLVPNSGRRWQIAQENCSVEVIGLPCLVREVGVGISTTTSVSPEVYAVI